jgi:hypothetical protein
VIDFVNERNDSLEFSSDMLQEKYTCMETVLSRGRLVRVIRGVP